MQDKCTIVVRAGQRPGQSIGNSRATALLFAREWGKPRAGAAAARDACVPLRRKMGTAWDVANASLLLASDEPSCRTGVALLVDGGASLREGD